MRYDHLDLGLAIAACVRGEVCKRYSDANETLVFRDGDISIDRDTGKSCKLQHAGLWLDYTTKDWYIVGDDKTWLDKEIK